MVTDDDVLTYGELDRETAVVASRFAAAGVGKGTRVGVLMPNGTAWPVVALGAARAGGTVVPLSTLLRPPELAAQLHTAGVEHLVVVPTFRGRDYLADLALISADLVPGTGLFVDALPRLRSIAEWEADRRVPTDDDVDREAVDARDAAIRPADDLAIIFTSGSRGRPKGVIHTHGGALGATAAGLDGAASRSATTASTSRCRSSGWAASGPACCRRWSPGPRCSPKRCPNRRARWRSSNGSGSRCSGVGPTRRRRWPGILGSPTPISTRCAPAVSTPSSRPSAACRARARANLLGMTESFGPYCGDRLDQPLPPGKEGSCGRAFAGIEIRIVDVDTGTPLGPDALGEIQLRGPNLMRGICGRPRTDVFTADEFYPTGDLGRLDADGYLYLTGRRDDMFKVRGATVYPSEVERALHGIRGVRRAFVVDIVHDGSTAVAAAVIATPDRELTVDELDAGGPRPAQRVQGADALAARRR